MSRLSDEMRKCANDQDSVAWRDTAKTMLTWGADALDAADELIEELRKEDSGCSTENKGTQ